ncbi:glutamate racemase [Shewanella psychropiezotolerans]|uniref:Glutamate racemase n=1 Tax=Shewanella psychropiezotolerans TaxID=2593655 RepID=A0ABX5X4G3_9GAMM|nr:MULTISPECIES: glutamate racemase [Shewanella]MPY25808.1 glutamate racemase [Shewanella sp. YLB-07]QDO86239.1 glutamate racemase [Shewanella psychropiezotolerans]
MSKPILVFDSGIGGLTILDEIRQALPNESYIYLFDNARLPYGELGEQELISGCVALITSFVKKESVSMVVIACNTASTLILPSLRAVLDIPVVGVVPAIKPAALVSQKKHLGLLATPGTIKRAYTHELIDQFAGECTVELYASSELVLLAEQKAAGNPVTHHQLAQILSPIQQSELDTLVLGCTHFPILKQEMQEYLGDKVILLDSGKAVAARVLALKFKVQQKQGRGEQDNEYKDVFREGQQQGCENTFSRIALAYYTSEGIEQGLKKTLAKFGFFKTSRLNHSY